MRSVIAITSLLLTQVGLGAQVPSEVLYRTVRIGIDNRLCSAFTLNVDDKQYLVTAKHCIGKNPDAAQVDRLQAEQRTRIKTDGKWLFPSDSSVDISAVRLSVPITVAMALPADLGGLMLSQQMFFTGFPSGLGSQGKFPAPPGFGALPFIKSGILSALDIRNENAVTLYLDGHNNPGFSGGPIVFLNNSTRRFQVAGVVSGFRNEYIPIFEIDRTGKSDPKAHESLVTQANSGIVIGYSIDHISAVIAADARSKRE